MVLGLAAASGMASAFGAAAGFVTKISETITTVKNKVTEAFEGIKTWVKTNWPDELTKAHWTNYEGTGVFDFDIDWDALFDWVPEGIFTKEYWKNDEGTGVLDFDIDWDALFSWVPEGIFTKAYWTNDDGTGVLDFDIDWDGLFDFTVPEILTDAYWSNDEGTGVLDFDIDWDGLFDFTLPAILTDAYWSNDEGTGVLDFDVDWDELFDFSLPAILTDAYWSNDEGTGVLDFDIDWDALFDISLPAILTKDYWTNDEGTGLLDFDIDWGEIWSGFIPDWLEDFSLGETMSSIGESIWSFIKPYMNEMIGGINAMVAYDLPVIGPLQDLDLLSGMFPIAELAKGGIVTSPTLALIGEAGPEAVIPLDKGGGGMGGTYNMTFNLSGLTDRSDKRQYAQEISRLIQQEMRRTVGAGTTRGRY